MVGITLWFIRFFALAIFPQIYVTKFEHEHERGDFQPYLVVFTHLIQISLLLDIMKKWYVTYPGRFL